MQRNQNELGLEPVVINSSLYFMFVVHEDTVLKCLCSCTGMLFLICVSYFYMWVSPLIILFSLYFVSNDKNIGTVTNQLS